MPETPPQYAEYGLSEEGWQAGYRAGVKQALEAAERVALSSSSHRIVDDILAELRAL